MVAVAVVMAAASALCNLPIDLLAVPCFSVSTLTVSSLTRLARLRVCVCVSTKEKG